MRPSLRFAFVPEASVDRTIPWLGFLSAVVTFNLATAESEKLRRNKPEYNTAGLYVYCATDPARQRRQLAARRAAGPLLALASPALSALLLSAAQHLFAALDERQRRWGAGFASLLWGPGGDQRAATWFGLHAKTVAKGRREVALGRIPPGRVRRPGGGRKALVKKTLP